MINEVHAILWDLDGTIVETKTGHFLTWQRAMEKYGFHLEKTLYDANFGRNNATLLPIFLGFDPDPDLKEEIIQYKESLFRELISNGITLVPGVESWLAAAHAMRIPQAIASSGPMKNILRMLSSANLERYFTAIVSGSDLPAKPEPDIFLYAAERLAVAPGNCLVVEDALAGVEAAHRAGMRCIAVTTSHTRDELSLADVIVDDFTAALNEVLETFRSDES